MFYRAERIINPRNREEIRRVFVTDEVGQERLRRLAGRVMDVYADVTGKIYSEFDRRDYPVTILNELKDQGSFELRFGMPKLDYPARVHGKLWGRILELSIEGEELEAVGFWTDTNDYDALRPQPDSSQAIDDSFDSAVKHLADREFDDIAVLAPLSAFSYGFYNPTQA